jgi:hypothetical protein
MLITIACAAILIAHLIYIGMHGGDEKWMTFWLTLIFGGAQAIATGIASLGYGYTVTPLITTGAIVLAVLVHLVLRLITGPSCGLCPVIAIISLVSLFTLGALKAEGESRDAQERQAREKADEQMARKTVQESEPLSLEALAPYAAYEVVRKYAFEGRYALKLTPCTPKGDAIFVRVPKDVYTVVPGRQFGEKPTIGELYPLFLILSRTEPSALQRVEHPPLPRMTRDQLSTTYGTVRKKLGDLGQRVLIIEVNGKELCFIADDDAFGAVREGQQLPLQK